MTRNELKKIIASVIDRLHNTASSPACGIFWADSPNPDPPDTTTRYAIGEEDTVTTRYAIGEEDS
jgi:hypothetical protein